MIYTCAAHTAGNDSPAGKSEHTFFSVNTSFQYFTVKYLKKKMSIVIPLTGIQSENLMRHVFNSMEKLTNKIKQGKCRTLLSIAMNEVLNIDN